MIGVRIDKSVKKKLEEEGVDITKEVRTYLERKAQMAQLKETIAELKILIEKNVKPSKRGWAAKMVREDRDAHN